jgi:hypothetical protein
MKISRLTSCLGPKERSELYLNTAWQIAVPALEEGGRYDEITLEGITWVMGDVGRAKALADGCSPVPVYSAQACGSKSQPTPPKGSPCSSSTFQGGKSAGGAKAPAGAAPPKVEESDGEPMGEDWVDPSTERSRASTYSPSYRLANFFTMEVDAKEGDPALIDKWGEGEASKVVFIQMAMAKGCVLCKAPLEPGQLFNEFRCSGCGCLQMIYPMKMYGMWFHRRDDAPQAADGLRAWGNG